MENIEKKTLKKTTSEQFELLCTELKKFPELASNKQTFGGNRNKSEELWAEICSKLNAIGPPSREVVEWKKVWSDLKGRTKKKIAANHKSLIATGGGPFQSETLTALEEMVDEAANIRSAAVPAGEVFGLEIEDQISFIEYPSTSKKEKSGEKYGRKRVSDSTNDLLREQVNQQKKLIDKIGDCYELMKENTEAVKKQADATEKLAVLAEKFFNYLNSE